jgi:hypothetical protein
MSIFAYTSITLNYLPKARTLFSTLGRQHPEWTRVLVLVEKEMPGVREALLALPEIDEVLTFEDLDIHAEDGSPLDAGAKDRWMFRHDVIEACTAVKGSALTKLLRRQGCEAVFYLDPDMVVLDRLDKLTAYLASGHSALLTPHTCEPESDMSSVMDNEIGPLRWGIFNLGFLGVANSTGGMRFAEWWKSRIELHCYNETVNGAFTDQSWCDLAPVFFDDVKIVKDPEFNVATWNLTNRKVTGQLDNLTVNDVARLAIFHFSGHDRGLQLIMLQKYGSDMPGLFELRDWYIGYCEDHKVASFQDHPWTYGCFDDGKAIPGALRMLYRHRKDLWEAFPRPFASAKGSLSQWYESKGRIETIMHPEKMHKHKPMRILFRSYMHLKRRLPFI